METNMVNVLILSRDYPRSYTMFRNDCPCWDTLFFDRLKQFSVTIGNSTHFALTSER